MAGPLPLLTYLTGRRHLKVSKHQSRCTFFVLISSFYYEIE